MTSRGYEMLGRVVWAIALRSIQKSLAANKAKIGAVATVALVLIGGVAAARSGGGED